MEIHVPSMYILKFSIKPIIYSGSEGLWHQPSIIVEVFYSDTLLLQYGFLLF